MPEAFGVWRLRFKISKDMVSFEKVRARNLGELVTKAQLHLAKVSASRDRPEPSPHFFVSPEQ